MVEHDVSGSYYTEWSEAERRLAILEYEMYVWLYSFEEIKK